jgi:hypothetical protein
MIEKLDVGDVETGLVIWLIPNFIELFARRPLGKPEITVKTCPETEHKALEDKFEM